jgi:hypothetical protein
VDLSPGRHPPAQPAVYQQLAAARLEKPRFTASVTASDLGSIRHFSGAPKLTAAPTNWLCFVNFESLPPSPIGSNTYALPLVKIEELLSPCG